MQIHILGILKTSNLLTINQPNGKRKTRMDTKEVHTAMEQKLDADLALLTKLVTIANEHKEVKAKAVFFECIAPCLSPSKVAEFVKLAQPKTVRELKGW